MSTISAAQTDINQSQKFDDALRAYHLNEYDRAESLLNEITDSLCGDDSIVDKCVESKILMGTISRNRRNLEKAEILLREALNIANQSTKDLTPVKIKLYVSWSYFYETTSDLDASESWIQKALELSELASMAGKPRARAYLAKGHLEDSKGNYNEAVDAYQLAIENVANLERDFEVLKILSQVYNNIGISYRRLGNLKSAMSHYQSGLKIAREAYGPDHTELAYLYNSIGSVHYTNGDIGTAAEFFLKSAAIFETNFGVNNELVAGALNNAALCYIELGDLDNATRQLERAQQIKEEILGRYHLDTAIGYSNLASIHQENDDTDSAEKGYLLSLEIRRNIYDEDHPSLIEPYIQLGKLYIQTERPNLAKDQLFEAARITSERLGDFHPNMMDIHLEMGNVLAQEREFKKADEHYLNSLNINTDGENLSQTKNYKIDEISYPLIFISTLKARGLLKIEQFHSGGEISNLHVAVDQFKRASSVIDQLQTQYQNEASKLNLIDQNYSIYTGAVKALYLLHQHTGETSLMDEIHFFAEKSKSRVALELLQTVQAKKFGGVPEAVLEEETKINEKITFYYQKFHLEKEKGFDAEKEKMDAYRDTLFYAQRELAEFTDKLERDFPSYYLLKYDSRLADRETIENILTDDETLINYVVGDEEIYAILISKKSISVEKLGSPEGLAEKIKAVRNSVTMGKTEMYREIAHSLYQKLVDPFIHKISTDGIIIVPDQMLHYLPFEMLLTEDTDESEYHRFPYLIRQKRIKYAPSATMLEVMLNQRPEDPRNLLAIAPFHKKSVETEESGSSGIQLYLKDLTPLPLTQYETGEISKIMTEKSSFMDYIMPQKAQILLNGDATKDWLMNESLTDYGFVHFATHAFVHESNPALSGLALHADSDSDGIAYVSDIYNLQMKADLVVLGACETGLGSIYKGEGIIGFTRAFIFAGASNLVVSMWRVNDHPTARLMIQFYRHISNGDSYGEALQKAKLQLIENPEMAAPRNWAAFVLNGR
ncbi:MAG: CHAT domain-containing tetratricopeptide repeat protein [Balneolaceae bacterium]